MLILILNYVLDHATSILAMLAGIGSFYKAMRVDSKVTKIHVEINSRMTQFLEARESLQDSRVETSRLEGKEAGRDQEMLRRAEALATVVAAKPGNQVPMPVEIVNPEPVAVVVADPTSTVKPRS